MLVESEMDDIRFIKICILNSMYVQIILKINKPFLSHAFFGLLNILYIYRLNKSISIYIVYIPTHNP